MSPSSGGSLAAVVARLSSSMGTALSGQGGALEESLGHTHVERGERIAIRQQPPHAVTYKYLNLYSYHIYI